MKVTLKAPIFTAFGLFKKGDVIEVSKRDFDENIMEPLADPKQETTNNEEEAPAKKPGRKKKEV